MSAQSVAKAAQGYQAKPVHDTCATCVNFSMEIIQRKSYYGSVFTHEKNLRCNLGGFKVGKMATCAKFAPKVAP